MTLEDARREAKRDADKHGHQIVVYSDPIAHAEDTDGPFGYIPTLAIPIFIQTLKYGELVEVVAPDRSAVGRRVDLENGLVELFRRNPNLIKPR